MAKSAGGVRGGSGRSAKNFVASVSVTNANGETRWLSREFRTQRKAEQWADNVGTRFDSNYNRTASANSTLIEHRERSGYMNVVGGRDLESEAARRERRSFRDDAFYQRDRQNYENYRRLLREEAEQRRRRRRR